MRNKLKFTFLFFACCYSLAAQNSVVENIRFGAYYFDGWTGKSVYHLNETLTNNFQERKPVWGWVTSTPEIMQKQIDLASDSGLDFFNFCWYYNSSNKNNFGDDPKNNALNLYLKTKDKKNLKFCLMIANHKGYIIHKEDWDGLIELWCTLFKDPNYVLIEGKPLITFFSLDELVTTFGTVENVNAALKKFKIKAMNSGLKGIEIVASVNPHSANIKTALTFDIDIISGYNYHHMVWDGDKSNKLKYSIDLMQDKEYKLWDDIARISKDKKKQIPVVTLNWDSRPIDINNKKVSPRLVGFSSQSVEKSILNSKKWIRNNTGSTTKDKIVFVYAWNEYGEGAWLTPSDSLKNSLLTGLKSGIKK